MTYWATLVRVRQWLRDEWKYQSASPKAFPEAMTAATATFGNYDDEWKRILDMYYQRAVTLGLDTQVGRQALGKYVATSVAMLANVVDVYGSLPPGGAPSGEVLINPEPNANPQDPYYL